MKATIIRILKLTAVILPVIAMLLSVPYSSYMETPRIQGFYLEEEDSLDVVFLGSSEIFAGFSSAYAYDQYGFTSYPYAVSSNYSGLFSYQLEEIVRTQHPQLVVVDISGALYETKSNRYDATFRTWIEGVPLSANKIRAIHEFPLKEQPLSYYLPFILYHGSQTRQDLAIIQDNQAMFRKYGASVLKGVLTSTGDFYEDNARDVTADFSRRELPEAMEARLRDFLTVCQSYDTPILFVAFPHRVVTEYAYERFQMTHVAEDIVREYGFDYVNLEHHFHAIGLDPKTDFYNDEHTNIYGQQKLTRYLSELLIEDYGLTPGTLSETSREQWERSAEFIHLYYDYFELLRENDPTGDNYLPDNAWVISELNWLKNKQNKG